MTKTRQPRALCNTLQCELYTYSGQLVYPPRRISLQERLAEMYRKVVTVLRQKIIIPALKGCRHLTRGKEQWLATLLPILREIPPGVYICRSTQNTCWIIDLTCDLLLDIRPILTVVLWDALSCQRSSGYSAAEIEFHSLQHRLTHAGCTIITPVRGPFRRHKRFCLINTSLVVPVKVPICMLCTTCKNDGYPME